MCSLVPCNVHPLAGSKHAIAAHERLRAVTSFVRPAVYVHIDLLGAAVVATRDGASKGLGSHVGSLVHLPVQVQVRVTVTVTPARVTQVTGTVQPYYLQ
jgi:hypothetical protein